MAGRINEGIHADVGHEEELGGEVESVVVHAGVDADEDEIQRDREPGDDVGHGNDQHRLDHVHLPPLSTLLLRRNLHLGAILVSLASRCSCHIPGFPRLTVTWQLHHSNDISCWCYFDDDMRFHSESFSDNHHNFSVTVNETCHRHGIF